jgi:hypothetical protein
MDGGGERAAMPLLAAAGWPRRCGEACGKSDIILEYAHKDSGGGSEVCSGNAGKKTGRK